jgi:hypothetical protein
MNNTENESTSGAKSSAALLEAFTNLRADCAALAHLCNELKNSTDAWASRCDSLLASNLSVQAEVQQLRLEQREQKEKNQLLETRLEALSIELEANLQDYAELDAVLRQRFEQR